MLFNVLNSHVHIYNSIAIYERLEQMLYKNIRVTNKLFYATCRSYNIITYYKLEIVYYYSIHAHMMRLIGSCNAKKITSQSLRIN